MKPNQQNIRDDKLIRTNLIKKFLPVAIVEF
jgi:hypothetical protein